MVLYNCDAPANVPSGVDVRDAREIVEDRVVLSREAAVFGKGSYGAFSDYFRYQRWYQRGGWWSDLDVVAVQPWVGFPDVVAASTYEKSHGQIANGFIMRFTASHNVLKRCIGELPPENLREMDISQAGPLLLHRILGAEGVAAPHRHPRCSLLCLGMPHGNCFELDAKGSVRLN